MYMSKDVFVYIKGLKVEMLSHHSILLKFALVFKDINNIQMILKNQTRNKNSVEICQKLLAYCFALYIIT